MITPQDLKAMYGEAIEALRNDATAGVGTATTRVRIRDGCLLACDMEDGDWRLIADEMPGDGGDGLGPDPGVFARAALGSCLAMGYVAWAAMLDVPIEGVEVTVEADYDAHPMLGLDDSKSPGWSAVRYHVAITSPAPASKVEEVVEKADRYSSLLAIMERPLKVSRELKVVSTSR